MLYAGTPVSVSMQSRDAARLWRLVSEADFQRWFVGPRARPPPNEQPATGSPPVVTSLRHLGLPELSGDLPLPLALFTALREVSLSDPPIAGQRRGLFGELLPASLRELTLRMGKPYGQDVQLQLPAPLDNLTGLTQLTRLTLEGYKRWRVRTRGASAVQLPPSLKVRTFRTCEARTIAACMAHTDFGHI